VSPRADLGNTWTISLTLDARDWLIQHSVAASSGLEPLRRLCNRIESSHHITIRSFRTTYYQLASSAGVYAMPPWEHGQARAEIKLASTASVLRPNEL
jgi:hypothetical protein